MLVYGFPTPVPSCQDSIKKWCSIGNFFRNSAATPTSLSFRVNGSIRRDRKRFRTLLCASRKKLVGFHESQPCSLLCGFFSFGHLPRQEGFYGRKTSSVASLLDRPFPGEHMNHDRYERKNQKEMNSNARDVIHEVAHYPCDEQEDA